MKMRVTCFATLLRLFLFFAVASGLQAQEEDELLRVDVRLVNLFVNVMDARNGFVGGLGREDFALSEDGRAQQIAVFERESRQPLNLTLAIDTSGSVHKDRAVEAEAARRFVQGLMRPEDQTSVLEFATNVRELVGFTHKVKEVDRALGKLHGDWATALYDAVVMGADRLGHQTGRKVLVIISDGDDTAKSSTYAQALEAALRNEVMVYSLIDVPVEASAGRDTGGEHALITLAEQTGGKSYYVSEGGLDKAFAQLSEDLRSQYLLAYYPRNQAPGRSFHHIELTIPRAAPGAFEIRCRTGYFVGPAEGHSSRP